MEKTTQYDSKLVKYTGSEERINTVSHAIGIVFAVAALCVMLIKSETKMSAIASVCFFLGIMFTYTNSTIYHALTNKKWKAIWRKIDHCSVSFVFVATGAPLCLCLSDHVYNYISIALCVGIAIFCSALSIINLKKFGRIALILDFVSAAILVAVFFVNRSFIPQNIRMLYLAGTLSCLLGAAFFGRKKEYMHAVFHIFELIGTVIFFFASLAIL